ncbi:MAG: TasA family protein [Lacrimispora saccharolytica]
MKNKKLIAMGTSVALVAVVGVGATLAYFTDQDTETNVVTMGNVDIDLDEPNFEGNATDNTVFDIVPNQTIVKDPTITLQDGSENAYIRANVTYSWDGGAAITPEEVSALKAGINWQDGWVEGPDADGDYTTDTYYFQNILTDEDGADTASLFTQVTIPASWGNSVANRRLQITVEAEAVQADNFTPETNEAGQIVGWGNVTPENYPVQ